MPEQLGCRRDRSSSFKSKYAWGLLFLLRFVGFPSDISHPAEVTRVTGSLPGDFTVGFLQGIIAALFGSGCRLPIKRALSFFRIMKIAFKVMKPRQCFNFRFQRSMRDPAIFIGMRERKALRNASRITQTVTGKASRKSSSSRKWSTKGSTARKVREIGKRRTKGGRTKERHRKELVDVALPLG